MQIVIDIPESEYFLIKRSDNSALADCVSKEAMMFYIKSGTPIAEAMLIPKEATNGDMIRALYGEPAKMERTGVLYKFKYRNGKPMFSTYYDLDWWNSPYERR